MDCKELTTGLQKLPALVRELGDFLIDRDIDQILQKKQEITEISDELYDEVEPRQVAFRDRIARKLGLSYLDKLQGSLAVGRRGEEVVLVNVDEVRIIPIHYKSGEVVKKRVKHINDFIDGRAIIYFDNDGLEEWSLIEETGYLVKDDFRRSNLERPLNTATEFPIMINTTNRTEMKYLTKDFEIITKDSLYQDTDMIPVFGEGKAWLDMDSRKFVLRDSNFKILLIFERQLTGYTKFMPFKNGASLYFKNIGGKSHVGLMDEKGAEVADFELGLSNENVFGLETPDELGYYCFKKGVYYFYFNEKGETIEGDFIEGGAFSKEGLAVVQDKRGFYYINIKGENVFGRYFRHAQNFSDGRALVEVSEGRQQMIDVKGGIIRHFDSGEYCEMFSDGVMKVDREDGADYYIDRYGEELFKVEKGKGIRLRRFEDGVAEMLVTIKGELKKHFVNQRGKIVFSNTTIDEIMEEIEGGEEK